MRALNFAITSQVGTAEMHAAFGKLFAAVAGEERHAAAAAVERWRLSLSAFEGALRNPEGIGRFSHR